MKKSVQPLVMFILLLFFFISCKKDDTTSGGTGGNNPTLPPTPLLTLSANTPWYNGTSTIQITTDAQTVTTNNQTVTGSYPVVGLKGDSTLVFIAKNTNQYGTTSTSRSITVQAYTQYMSAVCAYGHSVHQTYGYWRDVDSLNYPWILQSNIDSNIYQFFPNGTGQITFPNSTTGTGTFSLTGSIIVYSGFDTYNVRVDPTNPNGYEKWKIQGDPFGGNPGHMYILRVGYF